MRDMDHCEQPLSVWLVDPPPEASDVPTDARVLVGLIGMGEPDEASVELLRDGTAVAGTTETWCYEHEGPYERHCWISFRAALEADTAYSLRVKNTDSWQGTGSFSLDQRFTTGSALAETPLPMEVTLRSVADVEGVDCGWEVTRQYLFTVQPLSDTTRLGVVMVYDGDVLEHTVHPLVGEVAQMKQWRDASREDDGCYTFVHESTAGVRSAPVEVCASPRPDTGDTADSGDTALAEDSAGSASPSSDCGCGGGAAWFLPFGLLPWFIRRRVTA